MITDPAVLERRVRGRLDRLTKPQGSLGVLEELALRFSLIRGEEMPSPARKAIYVFCADHGITEAGVSPYPSEVTQQMMRNFVEGGAAINVLARRLEAVTTIVDAGAYGPPLPGIIDRKVRQGTRNFECEPAMTRDEAGAALAIGSEMADAAAPSSDMVGLGEMGIGNTTSAAAILSAFSGVSPQATVGSGAGHTPEGIARKIEVVQRALDLHKPDPSDGIGVLAAVGGFEIGAIAGFVLRASELRLPIILDGFPCCSAALVARAIRPDALKTTIFSHQSAEQGHALMLRELGVRAYFDFGLRLGEGTGAAMMMGMIDMAVRLYREMATFAEAGVSAS